MKASSGTEKIIAMDIWHVSLPVTSRREHGIGSVANTIDAVILRLTSESGAQGFGEASPWAVFTGTAENCFSAMQRYMRPAIIGSSIGDIAAIMERARKTVVNAHEALAALETALLDLAGRCYGVPIWALLGGKYRDEIPLSVSIANPDFSADLNLLQRLRDDKIAIVKLKTGIRGHEFDINRLETMRTDFSEFDVRIDYNQGLAPTGALRHLKDIEAFGVTFIEQPVARQHFGIMANLRAALDTPLMADESVFNANDMVRAIDEKICDCVSVKIMKSGGLSHGKTVSEIAAAAGMAAYGGDMFETGIAHLAGTHMIAASPNISLGCEFYQASYYLEHDLLTEPFPIKNGAVQVPNAPGLGMACDLEKLTRFAVSHVRIE